MPAWNVAVRLSSSMSQELVEARRVQGDDGRAYPAGKIGSTPPTTLVPPPKGTTASAVFARHGQHARDFLGARRIDDRVGRAVEFSASNAQKIGKALARRVVCAFRRIEQHVLFADRVFERRAGAFDEACGRQLDGGDGYRWREAVSM